MKACKDCRFRDGGYCTHTQTMTFDAVDGYEHRPCYMLRRSHKGPCGVEGALWEPKKSFWDWLLGRG